MPESDQGVHAKRYVVVPRVLVFLFDDRKRVLLIKGAEDKRLWAGLHNGIGGHVEPGEDVFEAAARELLEETGLIAELRMCGQIMIDVSDERGVCLFVFRGEFTKGNLIPSSEGDLVWINLQELETMPVVEDLRELLPRVAAHQVSDGLIIGKYQYDGDGSLQKFFR